MKNISMLMNLAVKVINTISAQRQTLCPEKWRFNNIQLKVNWNERSACDSGANIVAIINGVIFSLFLSSGLFTILPEGG